jgi:hypothetical protein
VFVCVGMKILFIQRKNYTNTRAYMCVTMYVCYYIYTYQKKKMFVTIYIYLYVCIQVRSDGKEIRSSMFMCANGKINNVSNAIINKDEPFDNGSLAK